MKTETSNNEYFQVLLSYLLIKLNYQSPFQGQSFHLFIYLEYTIDF